jgi:hypothetical protein
MTQDTTHRVLAIAFLAFLYYFVSGMIDVLNAAKDWAALQGPAGVAQILKAMLPGLGAVGVALKLDLPVLFGSFKKSEP